MSRTLEDFLTQRRRNFPAEGHIVSIVTSDDWKERSDTSPTPTLHVGVWEPDHVSCRLDDVEFSLSRNHVLVLHQAFAMALEQLDA